MKKLILLSVTLLVVSGCSLSEIDEVQSAKKSITDAKEKATQIKNDAQEKVEQAQNVKKEFDEFSQAWGEFSGSNE